MKFSREKSSGSRLVESFFQFTQYGRKMHSRRWCCIPAVAAVTERSVKAGGCENFLIRSAKLFAAHPFNIVLVGRATDVSELDGATRIGEDHDLDNRAIFRAIKLKSNVPIWLAGTSMGTISATAAAIRDGGQNVAGIVLTSSVTAYRIKGAVPTQALDKIKVPVLVVHHEQDTCKVCTPYEAKTIADDLKNAPIKKTVFISGGADPTGDPCQAMHFHGFIGKEKEVVDLIAAWVRKPSN